MKRSVPSTNQYKTKQTKCDNIPWGIISQNLNADRGIVLKHWQQYTDGLIDAGMCQKNTEESIQLNKQQQENQQQNLFINNEDEPTIYNKDK